MDRVKKMLLFRIPMSICNFRCSYCYLSHRDVSYQGEQAKMKYTPQEVAYSLRPERVGGLAYMNFCADGETLLTKNIDEYILELVKQGHYAEIVTNASVTPVIDKILSWDKELLKRVEFKCSFHYLELKKKNLLLVFADNIKKMWAAGASANIEITPSDDLIPYLDEVKEFSMEHFGALPHLSIARNDKTEGIDYLTELSMEEYDRIWSQFDSGFWRFKKSIFKQKRKEFCYAGDWLLYIDLTTGETTPCYFGKVTGNVFECPDEPLPQKPVGRCEIKHCYNGHALLTLGIIPRFTNVRYGDIRNREKGDGTQWLTPELLSFFNSTLVESNEEYSALKKSVVLANRAADRCKYKLKSAIGEVLGNTNKKRIKKMLKK